MKRMDVHEYIDQKKELQNSFLCFIENDNNDNADFENLINLIKFQNVIENKEEFKALLRLISKISKNHRRNSIFFDKIEQILLNFQDQIKQTFSNIDLFNLFKSNKRVLLFLLQKHFIAIDQFILNSILKKKSANEIKFCHFFYPEIKEFLNEKDKKEIEDQILAIDPDVFNNFDEKRLIGENDLYICQLIRNDSVKDFISHVTRTNFSLSSTIKPSIFETNPFLADKNPSLIEYSAFYGSIQIFQYLHINNVKLDPILWLYVIHGNNAEMIHFLEENKIKPKDESYFKCFEESIKCHHNDIARYIQLNILDEKNESKNFNENPISYCFHYYNYDLFPTDFNDKFIFNYLCQFDYFELVKFLMNVKNINLNNTKSILT